MKNDNEKLGYQWYPQTWWASDTRGKLRGKPTETLLYREVIDQLYMCDGRWAGTLQGCRRLLLGMRLTVDQFAFVRSLFNVSDAGLWSSDKVDKQLKKSQDGAESANKRWNKDRQPNGSPNGSPTTTPNGSPNTKDKKEKEKKEKAMPTPSPYAGARGGQPAVKETHPPTPRPYWKQRMVDGHGSVNGSVEGELAYWYDALLTSDFYRALYSRVHRCYPSEETEMMNIEPRLRHMIYEFVSGLVEKSVGRPRNIAFEHFAKLVEKTDWTVEFELPKPPPEDDFELPDWAKEGSL